MIDADWVALLEGDEAVHTLGAGPDVGWLVAFLAGTGHLDQVDDALPDDLVWGHLWAARLTFAAGRSARPLHERERVRVSLIGRLADALLSSDGWPRAPR